MPWPTMLSVPGHHGEAADPELLAWIKQLLDHVLGSSAWVIVAAVGLALVAFPVGLILFYLPSNGVTGPTPTRRREMESDPVGWLPVSEFGQKNQSNIPLARSLIIE